ncbi:MAG: hypothetical protein FJX44_11550 [Alphaproteobacteria bacterium]|nr:hypothetical protein [Alphaproteobacteria bacterium]
MQIGPLDTSKDIVVIAEIGNNHEGDAKLAEEMVIQAAAAGAHAVKFQSIDPRLLIAPDQPERIAQLDRFKLSQESMSRLAAVAHAEGLEFLSTPFYLDAVNELDPLVPAFKIASGDNDFIPLLEKIARTGKPIIMSCGMVDLETIACSGRYIRNVWQEIQKPSEIALLHCVSSYPTPIEEANLRAIQTLAPLADVVGYSDHTLGIEAAVAAAAVGARIIEKHFTLDKNQSDFRDHQLSADPTELKTLCEQVKRVNVMLGDGKKSQMPCEVSITPVIRRSIAAAHNLSKGATVQWEDLGWLRPGDGLPPGQEARLLGRTLLRNVAAGQRIMPEDCEA